MLERIQASDAIKQHSYTLLSPPPPSSMLVPCLMSFSLALFFSCTVVSKHANFDFVGEKGGSVASLFRQPSHFPISSRHCASKVRFCGPGFSSPVKCFRPRSAGNSDGEDFCCVLFVLCPNVCCTWKAMPGEPAKGGWAFPRGRQRLTWPPSRRQLCACTSQGVPGGQATPVGKKTQTTGTTR